MHIIRKPVFSLALVSLCLAACSQPTTTSLGGFEQAQAWGLNAIEVSSGGQVSVLAPGAGRTELESLNLMDGVKIRVTATQGTIVTIAGVSATAGQWVELPLVGLDKAAPIPVTVANAQGSSRQFDIASLPADFPDYTVTATSPKPGIICLTPNASDGRAPSYLVITDHLGKPLVYKRLANRGFNLQRHVGPTGEVRYSYIQVEGDQLEGVSTFVGSVRLLDGTFNEIERLMLLPNRDHGALPADIHDFVYLADGHYILTAYVAKTVTNIPSRLGMPTRVIASVVQEVKDGQVILEWDSTDHPEFYAIASNGNDYTNTAGPSADYMHMNALAVDPHDNHLLVSFRHLDQVLKLDRRTGEVRWRLGGATSDFPLTSEQRFSHQHQAIAHPDGTLTLFDNGNAAERSRMLTFTLDEASRTVKGFRSVEPEPRYSFAMGSYQKLDLATHFIGWGAAGDHPDATEWTDGGQQTFSLKFTDPRYETYRAMKYPQ